MPSSPVHQPSPLIPYTLPTPPSTLAMALPTPVSSTTVHPNGLPRPTSFIENENTHARKKSPGLIPRPRPAFRIFRCAFFRQNCVPPSVGSNIYSISRSAASVWGRMTDFQKQPWEMLAEEEKEKHAILYPDYKFQPRKRCETGAANERRHRSATQAGYDQRPPFDPSIPFGLQSSPLTSTWFYPSPGPR
ncbi:hypothetical protein F5146DRAFT_1067574 [Armillaria mellea]|nr:hypothetical protein F5146DRAFT_1067574 [Armillaria mellea]